MGRRGLQEGPRDELVGRCPPGGGVTEKIPGGWGGEGGGGGGGGGYVVQKVGHKQLKNTKTESKNCKFARNCFSINCMCVFFPLRYSLL